MDMTLFRKHLSRLSESTKSKDVYLRVFDPMGSVDWQSFQSGEDFDIKHSDLKKLEKLNRPLKYYTKIVSIAPDGARVDAGLQYLYILVQEDELKKIKLSTKKYKLEKSLKDELSYSNKLPNHEYEWNTEPNHGTIPAGESIKNYFKGVYTRATAKYKQYMGKFNPTKSWSELEQYAKSNKVFFHCSGVEHSPGDLIKGYWDVEHIKNTYSGGMGAADIRVTAMERDFESRRPNNKVSRTGCVFSFESIKDAKEWQKKFASRFVYAIEPTSTFSIHDMTTIDEYELAISDKAEAEEYAFDDGGLSKEDEAEWEDRINNIIDNYWMGKPSRSKPVNEVLISKAAKVLLKVRFN